MIILCAGPMRSGSTWQYNALRAIAVTARGSAYGAWIADYNPARAEPVHIIKVHSPDQGSQIAADAVVTGFRDLRDVFASVHRMGWYSFEEPKKITQFLDTYVRFVATWEERAKHVMRYESMVAEPEAEIQRMAAALGFELSPQELTDVRNQVSAIHPNGTEPTGNLTNYDRVSLLHPGHLSIGAPTLDRKTRRLIERRYAGWLRDRNYSISSETPASLLDWCMDLVEHIVR